MAPNGTTSRKTPAASKPSKPDDSSSSLISLGGLFADLDDAKPTLLEDVRKSLPVLEKAGSWDSKVTGGKSQNKDKERLRDRSSTPMNPIPSNLAKAFPTGRLMADKPDVLKCNHCKRPVLKHAMPAHIERCLNKKQEKQRKKKEAKDARDAAARKERHGTVADSDAEEVGVEEGAAGKKTAPTNGMTASKKRKAVDEGNGEGDTGPKKKKKKKDAADSKAKAPRPKAPVDVERQCGVELPQGGQCARSLTCKSHSMGAKRGVPGRSAPYDKLLNDYQRRNQAKLQKAAFDANAPDPDDEGEGGGVVDEEAETEAVKEAIRTHWGKGPPLYEHVHTPLRRKYETNRLRGLMASAMGDRSVNAGSGFFGPSGGGTGFFGNQVQPLPAVDANGLVQPRRGSVVPGARSMTIGGAGGASKKASTVAP